MIGQEFIDYFLIPLFLLVLADFVYTQVQSVHNFIPHSIYFNLLHLYVVYLIIMYTPISNLFYIHMYTHYNSEIEMFEEYTFCSA